jgi:hypothetical protein
VQKSASFCKKKQKLLIISLCLATGAAGTEPFRRTGVFISALFRSILMVYFDARRATLGLLASACLIAPATAQTYKGIYVVSIPNVNGSAANVAQATAYRKPFVDGVVIILHWSYLEPVAPGQTLAPGANVTNPFTGEVFCPQGTKHTNFCWQEIDEQLAHIGTEKKLSLAVVAGGYSPAWLASSADYGVSTTGALLYAAHDGTAVNCYSISLPLPSSAPLSGQASPSSFASAYINAMQQLSLHLSQKGRLGAVSIVKISGGINTVTEEFHLDAATTTGTCLTPATPLWADIGYRPADMETTWEYLAKSVSAVFPNALPSFDILEDSLTSSPLIDDTGTVFTTKDYNKNPSLYGTLLLDRALAALAPGAGTQGILGGAAVSVQWDGLAPADQQSLSTTATHTLAAGMNGAVIGFQANEMSGPEGSSCGTASCASATSRTTTCNGTATCMYEYGSLLDNGITPVPGAALQGAFIEVWAADVVNPCLAPALTAAHNTLTGSALKIGEGCK